MHIIVGIVKHNDWIHLVLAARPWGYDWNMKLSDGEYLMWNYIKHQTMYEFSSMGFDKCICDGRKKCYKKLSWFIAAR